jgi:glycine oxidase
VKVIVVGAGVVGSAVAHELASRGADVRILDSRGAGLGATRASAGILAPQIEGHLPALLKLATCSLAMYDQFIRRVEQDSGRAIGYERHGTLQVALDDAEAGALAEIARGLLDAGVNHTLVDRDGARALEPSLADHTTGALLLPMQGYVRATELTGALVTAAQARGARLHTTAALGIEGGTGVRVRTAETTMEADAVVVASGSWAVPSTPAQAPPVTPIRGQLLHLRLETAMAPRVIWGTGCYLVPWRDGSVLVGATVEDVGFDERSTADGVRGLLDAAIRLVPSLGRAHLQEVRTGLRPRGADELPIIGRSDTMPGVFYALAHYRNGVLLAPVTAALLADLVMDGRERPELALVKPDRRAGGRDLSCA